jgi:hypothetical protein
MVYDSTAMPINAGDRFKAKVTLHYNGTTADVEKEFNPTDDLYSTTPAQHTRTVTVTNGDVPQSIIDTFNDTRGAKVTIVNDVKAGWPVQITDMTVWNKANHNEKTNYDSATWEPKTVIRNGQNAVQTVMTSTEMPIRPGYQFEAVLKVLGYGGKTETITKRFDPSPELYSTADVSQNTRTVTLTDNDIPDAVKPPVTNSEENAKEDIANAGNGDTVVIDGVEWIKVRTDTRYPDLVLLMLKGVTGPTVKYDGFRRASEYGSSNPPTIRNYVDTWYANLNSPTLKKIACIVNLGESPHATWPSNTLAGEKNFIKIAFIPRLEDIKNLKTAKLANGYRYWNSDIYLRYYYQGRCFDAVGIVEADGNSGNCTYPDYSYVYARPCIWVTTK